MNKSQYKIDIIVKPTSHNRISKTSMYSQYCENVFPIVIMR